MTSTLSESSTLPLEPYIVDLLCDVAIAEGFTDCTLTASAGAKHGDGFLSAVVRVLITGRRNGGEQSSLSVIVKVPPVDEKRREEFDSAQSFASEANFYERVATTFAAFERERGVPADETLRTPRCLATRCDNAAAQFVLVLEDLRFSGWQLRDKFLPVDEAHSRRVAEGLARYHGVSMALRDQRPDVFAEFERMENSFLQNFETQSKDTLDFFAVARRRATSALDAADAPLVRKMEAAANDFVPIVQRCLRADGAQPHWVIGHGDFWNNNMMFQYDEANNPQRICIFDFQNSKLQSPAGDVLSYLFLSTDQQFRDQHMDAFLRHYHASLAARVRQLGSDPERLLPWTTFEADIRRNGVFVALTAPFMLQVTTAAAEDVRRNEEKLASGCTETNLFYCESSAALYERRVCDVLRTADAWGMFAAYEVEEEEEVQQQQKSM